MPEIGIALAAYRPDPAFFREQLQSLIDQTVKNWICVVTFDSELTQVGIDDPRIHFIQNPSRLGHVKNFEAAAQACLRMAPGIRAVAFCDQDDLWYPGKLQRLKETLFALPPFSAVHSNMNLLFPEGARVNGWDYEGRKVENIDLPSIVLKNVCTGASALFDAELFRKYPIIPAGLPDHDHWFAMLAVAFGRLVGIPEPLYDYRQHHTNVIGAQEKAGWLKLRKKWTLRSLANHLGRMNKNYRQIVSALPVPETMKQDLLSFWTILRTTIRALNSRNTMLARAGVGTLLGFFTR
jgi:glycosyltransferase involved in cell wall biosynthesis